MKRHGNIRCKSYDELVEISTLKRHPKNPNTHSQDQLAVYAAILAHQGVRQPVRVSRQSGYVTKGHGQIFASELNDWTHVPVEYQDYESSEQEYADLVADNALARQAEIDYGMVNAEMPELGPDFDLTMLAIPGFTIDRSERSVNNLAEEWSGMPDFDQSDKRSFRHVVIHFRNTQDAEEFFKRIDYPDTGKTRSLWFPPQENLDTETRRYAAEE